MDRVCKTVVSFSSNGIESILFDSNVTLKGNKQKGWWRNIWLRLRYRKLAEEDHFAVNSYHVNVLPPLKWRKPMELEVQFKFSGLFNS